MRGAAGSLLSGHQGEHQADGHQRDRELDEERAPHQNCSSSAPPVIGPKATARPVLAPHRPIALARAARSRKTWVRIDRVVGKTAAAPIPVKARAAMSCRGCRRRPRARCPGRTRQPDEPAPPAGRAGRTGCRRPARARRTPAGSCRRSTAGRGWWRPSSATSVGRRDVHDRGVDVDGEHRQAHDGEHRPRSCAGSASCSSPMFTVSTKD
jgi:hypothetical protein